MTTAIKAPAMTDTFTFFEHPSGDIGIMQHYAEAQPNGSTATPIGYIKGNAVEWTCESAPLPLSRMIGLGILAAVDKLTDLVDEAEEAVPGTFIPD